MTCSPARLAANRANAAKSTGPKTDEGKAISRANALKHGLAAEVVRTPEEAVAARPLADWLEGEVVVLTMRIDRAHQVEERERERAALRADTCWDDDRRREAERIARGLAKQPERVVSRLKCTPQGCAWMIERWRLLLAAAGQEGGWTSEQRALADDLQGISRPFRGRICDDGQAETAGRELAELEQHRERLGRSDDFERETTKLGLDDGATPELRRVIRYEAALHRRLRWCMDQLGSGKPPEKVPDVPRPEPARTPPARPAPAPPEMEDPDFDDFAELDALFGRGLPPLAPFNPGVIPASIFPRQPSR